MKTFHEYFFGGLEILYDEFVQSCTTDDDYITRIYTFVEDFWKEQDIDNIEIDVEQLLRN